MKLKRVLYVFNPKEVNSDFRTIMGKSIGLTLVNNVLRVKRKIHSQKYSKAIIISDFNIESKRGAEDYSYENGLEVLDYANERKYTTISLLDEGEKKILDKIIGKSDVTLPKFIEEEKEKQSYFSAMLDIIKKSK